jgi:hypothetical protein
LLLRHRWSTATSSTGDVTGWQDLSIQDRGFPFLPQDVDVLDVRSSSDRGAYKGYILADVDEYGSVLLQTDPFLITHTELSYARIDVYNPSFPLNVHTDAGTFAAHVAGPTSTDAYTNCVVPLSTDACATMGHVEIQIDGQAFADEWYIDDVALSGPICAEYLDADGDGLCPLGTDLDADGDCTDPTEISTQSVDCNDTEPAIAACLPVIDAPRWWALGEPYKVVVGGLNPNETVHLVASLAVGQTCPSRLAGLCLGLDRPLIQAGSVQADGAPGVVQDVNEPLP